MDFLSREAKVIKCESYLQQPPGKTAIANAWKQEKDYISAKLYQRHPSSALWTW